MDDFTSTELMRVVHAALVAEGSPLAAEIGSPPDPMRASAYPTDAKRSVLEKALGTHGAGFVLGIGRHIRKVPSTPLMTALARPQPPAVTAEKWTRLERYHHSAHRTAIESQAPGRIAFRHHGNARSTPTRAEDLLIAGCLLTLLAPEGQLEIAGLAFEPAALPGVALPDDADTATFTVSWDVDVVPLDIAAPAEGALPADRLPRLIATDVGRRWTLPEAARALAQSPRTMQRRLAAEGRTFSTVVRAVRMQAATRMLDDPDVRLAEIGYCCGYADQAHFQRDFVRATRLTPDAYRRMSLEARPTSR